MKFFKTLCLILVFLSIVIIIAFVCSMNSPSYYWRFYVTESSGKK